MVRKLVLLLILANLVLLGWMLWGKALVGQDDLSPLASSLHPEKIRLLESTLASAPVAASSVQSAPVQANGKPAQTTGGLALSLSPLPVLSSSAHTASTSSVPAAVVEKSPASQVMVSPSAVATESVVQDKAQDCAEWGEFSGDDLQRAKQAVATLRLGDSVLERIETRERGYWVYIPPSKKRSEAEKKMAQLKQSGITDLFLVMEEGKWKYAISLGIFKTEEGAKKRLEALRKKGVRSAKTAPRSGKLKFTIFSIKGLDSGIRDKLNALQKEFPNGEMKMMACGN